MRSPHRVNGAYFLHHVGEVAFRGDATGSLGWGYLRGAGHPAGTGQNPASPILGVGMSVELQCPECQSTLRIADENIGKRSKCPSCAHVFTVDGASGVASSDANRIDQRNQEVETRWWIRLLMERVSPMAWHVIQLTGKRDLRRTHIPLSLRK